MPGIHLSTCARSPTTAQTRAGAACTSIVWWNRGISLQPPRGQGTRWAILTPCGSHSERRCEFAGVEVYALFDHPAVRHLDPVRHRQGQRATLGRAQHELVDRTHLVAVLKLPEHTRLEVGRK